MTRALLLGLLFAPLACADDEPPVEPMSGTWLFIQGEITKNTCAEGQGEPSSGDFTLLNNADGTFVIEPQDDTEPFLCTLTGADFTCPKRLQTEEKVNGLDATITVRVSATGTFSSNRAASGQQDAIVECTGSACALVTAAAGVTLPCDVSATYTASFKQ